MPMMRRIDQAWSRLKPSREGALSLPFTPFIIYLAHSTGRCSMSKKSPSDDNFEQSKSPSDRGSSQLSGQPARKRYNIRKILNLIFGVGLLVLATCGVFLYLQTSGVLSSTSEPR